MGFSFAQIDYTTLNRILNTKFEGANYSGRIWNNTSELSKRVKEGLLVWVLNSKIFGEDIGETFEEFQDMKYNDVDKWSAIKKDKQNRINQLSDEKQELLNGKLSDFEVR